MSEVVTKTKYAVVVKQMSVCRIIGRTLTKAGALKVQRAFIFDWRRGRVRSFDSDERGAFRRGFTAPRLSPDEWQLKSGYSKNSYGVVTIINTKEGTR